MPSMASMYVRPDEIDWIKSQFFIDVVGALFRAKDHCERVCIARWSGSSERPWEGYADR